MVSLILKKTLWVIFSFIVAWGFNNITRQLTTLDSGVIIFLTVSSLSFILGTLLYTRAKDDKLKKELVYRFILTGMGIIFALSLTGFIGDARTDQRIVAFHSCEVESICGTILTHLASFLNFAALFIFFYSSLELIYYFKKDHESAISSRRFTYLLIAISIILYIFLSGILTLFRPLPDLNTYTSNITDETFLHIEGKEWLIAINLTGFGDLGNEPHPTRFFLKNNGPVTVSAFAERFPKVFNDQKCRSFYLPSVKEGALLFGLDDVEMIERNNQLLLMHNYTFGGIKINSVNYYDYYDGYCFDFHITEVGEINRTYDILDSIKLVIPY